MKTIIVDDEPKAIALISSYLSHYSQFELVSTFRNGLKAIEYLNQNTVDIAFLDINMPHLNGLTLSKMLPDDTLVVFTTAYSEYAVESYTVNAVDYLLKPISLQRFNQTVAKLTLKKVEPEESIAEGKSEKKLFIKSGTDTYQIEISSIDYLKKDGNYIHYIMGDRKVMARQSIAEAMEGLNSQFIQVQKSYIINFEKVYSLNSEYVVIGQTQIPLGDQFKTGLMKKINK